MLYNISFRNKATIGYLLRFSSEKLDEITLQHAGTLDKDLGTDHGVSQGF